MSTCPNISGPEWQSMVKLLGEDNTWKIWIKNDDSLVEPRQAMFQLFIEQEPKLATKLLNKNLGESSHNDLKLSSTTKDLVQSANDSLYDEPAFKSWIEKKGYSSEAVSKPVEVSQKTIQEEIDSVPEMYNEAERNIIDDFKTDAEAQNKERAKEIARKMADKISKQTGIPYELISQETANQLLISSQTPYGGEDAFFFGGTAYFIEDKLSLNSVFHEFAHPIIKAIEINNPVLFESLYSSLISTPEGARIVDQIKRTSKLEEDSEAFKREAIVIAIEGDAMMINHNNNNPKNPGSYSPGFINFIKELFYQVRQYLRKTFGRVRVEKLKSTTTLNELSKMLINNDFVIDTQEVTDNDIAEFISQTKAFANEITDSVNNDEGRKKIQNIINNFMATASKQKAAIKWKVYEEIRPVFEDPGKGLLNSITGNLRAYTDINLTPEEQEVHARRTLTQQAEALTDSLFVMQKVSVKLTDFLENLANKSGEISKDDLTKALYYNSLLEGWSKFLSDTEMDMIGSGVSSTSGVYGFVSGMDGVIQRGLKAVRTIQREGSVNVMYDVLQGYIKEFTEKIDSEIKTIRQALDKKPGDDYLEKELNKKLEEKERFLITKERMKDNFSGHASDANWFGSMFVSFTANPDPVVGSFALFLKNAMAKVQAIAIAKQQKFNNTVVPLLFKGGITGTNNPRDWNSYIVVDKDATIKDGVVQEVPRKVFISKFKDYRYGFMKLQNDIDIAREKGDPEELKLAYQNFNEGMKWFNREYSDAVYLPNKKILETEEGVKAWDERRTVLEEMRRENPSNDYTEFEKWQKYDSDMTAKRKYNQLYSLTNEDGTPKIDTESDKALTRTNLLIEHKKATSKFYEWRLNKRESDPFNGVFDDALENFEKQLQLEKPELVPGSIEYEAVISDWLKKNTIQTYKEDYTKSLSAIFKKLETISKDLPQELIELSQLYKDRSNLTIGYKDQFGQTDPTMMSPERIAKFRDLEEKIISVRESFTGSTGLSIEEMDEFAKLEEVYESYKAEEEGARAMTEEEKERYRFLVQKSKLNKVDPAVLKAQKLAIKELTNLRKKRATSIYVDTLNNILKSINEPLIDETDVDSVLTLGEAERLMDKSEDFKLWFLKNHLKSTYRDKTGTIITKYQRLDIWNVGKAANKAHYNTITLKRIDPSTGKNMIWYGVPGMAYRFRTVKDEYKTKRVVGETVDNKGNWLPKDIPGSPYINVEYYKLIEDSNKRALLNAITSYHLENQDGLARADKLYLDLPRYPITDSLQRFNTGTYLKQPTDTAKSMIKGLKALATGKGIEAANATSIRERDIVLGEANAKVEEENARDYVNRAFTDPVIDRLYLRGLSNIPIEDVSMNVLDSVNQYMFDSTKQKVYADVNPVAKAVLNTLRNTEDGVDELGRVKTQIAKNSNVATKLQAVSSLYEREFMGVSFKVKHMDAINKATGGIMKAASFNYFALNLPSAIKNYWGALWQHNIEAIAGEYMDPISYGKGKLWAKSAMFDWTNKIYKADNNSLSNQLIMYFDPMQGKTEEVIATRSSRGLIKDILSLSWLYSPRKFMDMEASIQLFAGMMYHKMVPQTIDGVTKNIPYIEAFELNPAGEMVLKAGISEDYSPLKKDGDPGEEFLAMRNKVHEKSKDLNGAFAKFEQPQAQAYFAYRLTMFMRRYFTDMFMNRFGSKRANYTLGTVRTGFYREAIMTVAKILRSLGSHINVMSPSEKRSLYRLSSEFAQFFITGFIISAFFGYDDEDPERFAKLKAKSGALGSDDFHLDGYISNHMLNLFIKTQNENVSLIPLPRLGLEDYTKMSNIGSIAFGPTLISYSKILTDIAMHMAPGENEGLYYQRDVGPYPWQHEESAKIWNHIGAMIGVTGSDVDPVKSLQSFDSVQNRFN